MANDMLTHIRQLSQSKRDAWLEGELEKRLKQAKNERERSLCKEPELDISLMTPEERIRTRSRRKWLHDRASARATHFANSFRSMFSETVMKIFMDCAEHEPYFVYPKAVSAYKNELAESLCMSIAGKKAEIAALKSVLDLIEASDIGDI